MLEIGVMGGDDAECSGIVKSFKNRFGNGTTQQGFSTTTKLIDEEERTIGSRSNELLHVLKMRRICGEVVFNRLLIAYVY